MKNDNGILLNFEEPFNEYIIKFIKYRQNCGFKYGRESQRMLKIISQELSKLTKTPVLTLDIILTLSKIKIGESYSKRSSLIDILRQLSVFIHIDNPNSCIVPKKLMPIIIKSFVPYILTKEQILKIFEASDNIKPNWQSNYHITLPVIIRLLYSSGLRINEALSLQIKDLNFEDKSILIRESKKFKSRIIPLSDSMYKILINYIKRFNFKNENELIFQSINGNKLTNAYIGTKTKQIFYEAGINEDQYKRMPTLHSLRHTFACHALDKMHDLNMDTNVYLVLLSQYLGHDSLSDTEKYLRFPQYKITGDERKDYLSKKIPEVEYEEE